MKFQSGDIIVDVNENGNINFGHGVITGISVSGNKYKIFWSKRDSISHEHIDLIDDVHILSTDIFREEFK